MAPERPVKYRVAARYRVPELSATLTECAEFDTAAEADEFARHTRAQFPAAEVCVEVVSTASRPPRGDA